MKINESIINYIAYQVTHPPTAQEFSEIGTAQKVTAIVRNFFIQWADWLLQSNQTYQSLKKDYLKPVESEQPLQPAELPKNEEIEIQPSPPVSQKASMLKIGCVVGAIFVAGLGLYFVTQTSLRKWKELSLEEQSDILESLHPVCREAVKSYCKPLVNGTKVCLQKFLAPNWKPYVHVEYDRDILCAVYLRAVNCLGLPFIKNFEKVPFTLPANFSESVGFALSQFKFFKSHIFCESL